MLFKTVCDKFQAKIHAKRIQSQWGEIIITSKLLLRL